MRSIWDDRRTLLFLITLALAGYGVYIASFVPAVLAGSPMLWLVVAFVVQVVCAWVAAVGVWRGQRWAAGVVVALGAAIAVTWLLEAFVLGLVAYLRALLIALLALVVAVMTAMYLDRRIGRQAA
jgi:hypothetical protein